MRSKLTSRKFWICVAAMLSSIATSIVGLGSSNQTVVVIGTVCAIVSAGIYAFCEAWVDSKSIQPPTNRDKYMLDESDDYYE